MLRRVTVENGVLQGLPAADPRITVFKGVPFAAPPVGENRWRAPQPAENWEGVRECYKFAPISMQKAPGSDPDDLYSREWNVDPETPMSEDCLYLNVWTPARGADEKLPVFVWYFGGGWQNGSTAEMEFDGERLARRGIVVVTVNYRLNIFGFLAHPELSASQPDAPSNFGYLDQRFGTMWVKRNIAAFGGDPENVTIGGQSAGGSSVLAQVVSPLNRGLGLFRKAIVASGMELMPYRPGMISPPSPLAEQEKRGEAFFELLGVKTLAEARALDAEFIRSKVVETGTFFPANEDGVMNAGFSSEMLLRGEVDFVPMLLGHTATEFPITPMGRSMEEYLGFARAQFGEATDEFLRLTGSKTGSLAEMRHKAAVSHMDFSIRRFAREKARRGDETPLYYWVFGPEIPGWDNPGNFHSSDLWFWFETLAKCWRPFVGKHYDLARQMCNYWANFIRSGDPNGPDADGSEMPAWRPFTEAEPWRIYLGDKAEPQRKEASPVMEFLLEQAEKD